MAQIKFKGLYSKDVLGIFAVIRGYANLKDLALISKPYNFESGAGYQRVIDEQHARDIKKYFESAKGNKFIPEIILGLRLNDGDTTISIQDIGGDLREISIEQELLEKNPGIIRRIDGNHRLHFAKDLADDATRPNQYRVPFSMLILGPVTNAHDDVAEALIFHTINFKGKPITSEHGLNVILTTETDEQKLFDEDPIIFATQYVYTKFKDWPGNFLEIFGQEKLSNIYRLIEMMSKEGITKLENKEDLKKDLSKIFEQTYQIFTWAKTEGLGIATFYEIIPAIVLILKQIADFNGEKIDDVKRWLKAYDNWLVSNKLLGNFEKAGPSELWSVFKRWKDNQPKNIFVACSFDKTDQAHAVRIMIEEAIQRVKTDYPDVNIQQVRIDEQHGGSFVLSQKIFGEIDDSDLIIADLTGEKVNVYCEVGYARGKNKQFILTYKPLNEEDGNVKNKIHTDLLPYKYIQYNEVSQLRDELIKDIKGVYGKS